MSGQSWAQLRQQARQLESQTETLFQNYSQYAQTPDLPPKPSLEEEKTEQEIKDVLEKRESTLKSLTTLLDSQPQPSALKSSHLSRHRETLQTHTQDLSRIKTSIQFSRDRSNLLSSVRRDISTYRAGSSSNPSAPRDPADEEADYLLDERDRLDRSNRVVDGVLSQAYAVNETFGIQREQLERVRQRVRGVVGMVPGLNNLMGRIGSKKRRDGIILGGFIAVCFLVFLWFST